MTKPLAPLLESNQQSTSMKLRSTLGRPVDKTCSNFRKMATKRTFFGTLESLRGVAAFLVVLAHMPPAIWALKNILFIQHGVLMVPFFFVLSGFVICYNYYEVIFDKTQFFRFIFLRFFRLYPVHFVFLLVWLSFEIARYVAYWHYGIRPPVTVPFHENSIQALIENIFLVQALGFSSHATSFNGPSWSISVEFYTYVIFGVVVLYLHSIFLFVACAISA